MSTTVLEHRPRTRDPLGYLKTVVFVAAPPILAAIAAMYLFKTVSPFPAEVNVRDAGAVDAIASKVAIQKLFAFVVTGVALALTVGFRMWRTRAQTDAVTIVLPEPASRDEVINRFMTPEDYHSDETGTQGH